MRHNICLYEVLNLLPFINSPEVNTIPVDPIKLSVSLPPPFHFQQTSVIVLSSNSSKHKNNISFRLNHVRENKPMCSSWLSVFHLEQVSLNLISLTYKASWILKVRVWFLCPTLLWVFEVSWSVLAGVNLTCLFLGLWFWSAWTWADCLRSNFLWTVLSVSTNFVVLNSLSELIRIPRGWFFLLWRFISKFLVQVLPSHCLNLMHHWV